jgi:hypothetical protein
MVGSNVSREHLINKVWEVAQDCVDEKKKGWMVKMETFREAMDGLDFGHQLVCEALHEAEIRAYAITRVDEDGYCTAISIVPQRYQCWHCRMWLDMQDHAEDHIELCYKQQTKIERNRLLDKTVGACEQSP